MFIVAMTTTLAIVWFRTIYRRHNDHTNRGNHGNHSHDLRRRRRNDRIYIRRHNIIMFNVIIRGVVII